MKAIKEITVGSRAFFSGMPDFHSKDHDVVIITDDWMKSDFCVLHCHLKGKDCFIMPNFSKDKILSFHSTATPPMQCIKFLSKEFYDFFGITIDDLKGLSYQFDVIDKKHRYAKYIFDCYLSNGSISLSPDQLNEAYKIYKSDRPEVYGG